MNKKSEGLDISIPRVFRRDHAPVESLTENERRLRKEILESIKKVITDEPRLVEIYISVIKSMAIKYGVDISQFEI
ncbi:TPA: hypothetical protein I1D83_002681 [Staphylococcus aureus]|nr:hypothetical protein [Staphylococcus aureus]NGC02798.1 hypothetical protein [Staphylococcus aureus]NGD38451.1 hypothetical protein [Staphylococcus aureus]HAR3619560.1 hypothetical protein [Staphylococcus aureus]HAR3629719.1 hypothetical protein [Staphylococcus aureus]